MRAWNNSCRSQPLGRSHAGPPWAPVTNDLAAQRGALPDAEHHWGDGGRSPGTEGQNKAWLAQDRGFCCTWHWWIRGPTEPSYLQAGDPFGRPHSKATRATASLQIQPLASASQGTFLSIFSVTGAMLITWQSLSRFSEQPEKWGAFSTF